MLYRLIDEAHPTLLIDEVDNLGLALHRMAAFGPCSTVVIARAATVRDLGAWLEYANFSTFAPLALALARYVRGLPRTLNYRCITITMERHDGQRQLQRFDAIQPDPALEVAYHQILLWRQEVELNSDPELPLRNRFADNWRPLISIADSLGWGEQAREALVIFAREYHDADVKILLLTDIRKVFDLRRVDYLPTKILLEALYEIDGAEWSEFCGVRGDQPPHKLKDTELARMLRDFAIRPRTIWPPNRTPKSKSAKGYRRSQFEGAWRKYCADDGTTAQGSNIMSLRRAGDGTV